MEPEGIINTKSLCRDDQGEDGILKLNVVEF